MISVGSSCGASSGRESSVTVSRSTYVLLNIHVFLLTTCRLWRNLSLFYSLLLLYRFRYFAPVRWAKYCDLRMCMSVCLSVWPHAYLKNHRSNFHQFSVHITCGRGLVLLWRRCNMLCNSSFVDDVMMSCFNIMGPMGQNQVRCCFIQFVMWRHWEQSLPSPIASCLFSILPLLFCWRMLYDTGRLSCLCNLV